jgi:hypothetical protein
MWRLGQRTLWVYRVNHGYFNPGFKVFSDNFRDKFEFQKYILAVLQSFLIDNPEKSQYHQHNLVAEQYYIKLQDIFMLIDSHD